MGAEGDGGIGPIGTRPRSLPRHGRCVFYHISLVLLQSRSASFDSAARLLGAGAVSTAVNSTGMAAKGISDLLQMSPDTTAFFSGHAFGSVGVNALLLHSWAPLCERKGSVHRSPVMTISLFHVLRLRNRKRPSASAEQTRQDSSEAKWAATDGLSPFCGSVVRGWAGRSSAIAKEDGASASPQTVPLCALRRRTGV